MTVFRQTNRLTLREFQMSDAVPLAAYRGDPEIARFQSWSMFDGNAARNLITTMQDRRPGTLGEGYQMAVALWGTDTLIGDLYIRPLEYDVRQAEIGYTFARTHQGLGYATEAVTGLLDYLFQDLKLHRVVAYTATENERSVKLLERIGFRREGYLRQSYESGGHWHDEYLYAKLRTEWRPG